MTTSKRVKLDPKAKEESLKNNSLAFSKASLSSPSSLAATVSSVGPAPNFGLNTFSKTRPLKGLATVPSHHSTSRSIFATASAPLEYGNKEELYLLAK